MFYLGIDVSKAKLDCCLLLDNATFKRKDKSIANNHKGFNELLAWIQKQSVALNDVHIIMEATGVYHEQAAYAFHDAGIKLSLANPAYVRHFANGLAIKTKTDCMDSFVLARYGLSAQPQLWTPAPIEARLLQALLNRREAIAQDLQRERNRQEKAEVAVSPDIIQQSIKTSIAFLEQQLKQLQQDIDDHVDKHPKLKQDVKLLETIPAVGERVGNTMLSVLHNHHFESAEQVAAYLGLVPVEYQSGTSVLKRPRLSKTGSASVRATLYMAAVVATKYNPHIKKLYERLLAKGKCKMLAIGAAMRKLVHLCFGVWKNQTPYQEDFLPKNAIK
jgi:transposase